MATGASGATRRLRTWVVPFVFVAVAVALWPTAWGGATTYVRVTGTSMEPGLVDGDLVVARAGSYEVGDVVVYPVTDGLVIHRIVGIDDDGRLVTRGDNRARVDPWTPPASAVLGAEWLHVPRLGSAVVWIAGPVGRVAVASAVGLWITAAGARRHRRKRRRGRKEVGMRQRQPHTSAVPPPEVGPLAQGALVIGAVLSVFGLVGTAMALTRPVVVTVDEPLVTGTAVFDVSYDATAPTSRVYPDGGVGPVHHAPAEDADDGVTRPPQPLYRALISALDADATFAVHAPGGDVEGRHRLHTVLRTPDGWEERLTSTPWEDLTDGRFARSATIDLRAAERVAADVAELTEGDPTRFQVAVRAEIQLVTAAGDVTVEETLAPEFAFEVGSTVIEPITPQQHDFPIELTAPATHHTTTLVGPLPVRTSTARLLAPLLALGGSVLAFPVVGARYLGFGQRPAATFRTRRRGIVVDVEPDACLPGPIVPVVSPNELVRLARRADTMILHADLGAGRNRFAVPALDATYVYTFEDRGATALPVDRPVDPTPEEVTT